MKFEIDGGKNQDGNKCRENESDRRCKGSPDASDPVPDVSNYLYHGGTRNQLAKGDSLQKFLFPYPAVIVYDRLLGLSTHSRTAIGCGSKFEKPFKKKAQRKHRKATRVSGKGILIFPGFLVP